VQLFSKLLLATAVVCVTLSAHAQVRPSSIEVVGYAGYLEADSVIDEGLSFGGRVQFNLHRLFGVEATYGVVNTTQFAQAAAGTEAVPDLTLGLFAVDGVLHLSYGRFVPFLMGGAGFIDSGSTDYGTNLGLGAKYYISELVGFRVEARNWLSSDAPATDLFSHFEVTAGLVIQLGGVHDLDGDGVPDRSDLCPSDAEDRDDYKDADGCPDIDNDGDLIPDIIDKCPLEAEDRDGDRDADGCPDDATAG
jgi:hypothetical protein